MVRPESVTVESIDSIVKSRVTTLSQPAAFVKE